MAQNKSFECREMIITCISYMVQSHADKIRSGWKNVFSVCTMAASDNREHIVTNAFNTIAVIIGLLFNYFNLVILKLFL